MTPNDSFTVTISLSVDRTTGGVEKEGRISEFNLIYNRMDYGDVVAVEALVTETLLPALVGAGYEQAAAMGIDVPAISRKSR